MIEQLNDSIVFVTNISIEFQWISKVFTTARTHMFMIPMLLETGAWCCFFPRPTNCHSFHFCINQVSFPIHLLSFCAVVFVFVYAELTHVTSWAMALHLLCWLLCSASLAAHYKRAIFVVKYLSHLNEVVSKCEMDQRCNLAEDLSKCGSFREKKYRNKNVGVFCILLLCLVVQLKAGYIYSLDFFSR